MTLTICDTTFSGKILNEISILIDNERTNLKDIIMSRVYAEVSRYNTQTSEFYQGLIQPTDSEITLNGFKMLKNHKIDAEKQALIALDAFTKNGFFVLIDDVQEVELKKELLVNEGTRIQFVKLTQLVGG